MAKKVVKKAKKKVVKKSVKKPVKKTKKAKKTVKKVVVKPIKKQQGKPIGKITHYFSNIEVCVIDLAAPIKEGDIIRIMGGEETDFNQPVSSMQIEHEKVKSAKKGDSVGLKVKEKVREGYKVFKV